MVEGFTGTNGVLICSVAALGTVETPVSTSTCGQLSEEKVGLGRTIRAVIKRDVAEVDGNL